MKISITQIWMVCHLLPFAKVGQCSLSGQAKVGQCHDDQSPGQNLSATSECNTPYAYDVIISLRPPLGGIHVGLHINAVVRNVPVADHKRVQSNGLYPQHGGAMTSMHKVL